MSDTYKCAHCGGVFEKGWSDEEAKSEAKDNFGSEPSDWNDNVAVVCDDCYQEMQPKNHPMERVLAILKINSNKDEPPPSMYKWLQP